MLGAAVGAALALVTLVVFRNSFALQNGRDELFSAAAASAASAAATALPSASPQTANCTVREETVTVRGTSMEGILSDGERVTVLQNYYACHAVARGDIVDYDYGGPEDLVKSVMGVPGDTLAFQKSGSRWHILINGAPLVNAQGETYLVSDAADRMLALYVGDQGGIILADAYLVLGNNPAGSIDSTWFGLASAGDFKGKVDVAVGPAVPRLSTGDSFLGMLH
jgi:signal peptidase I